MVVPSKRRRVVEDDDEPRAQPDQASTSAAEAAPGHQPVLPADLQDLEPQPLGKQQAPNLKTMIAEFKYQTESISQTIKLLLDTAEQMAETCRNDQDDEPLRQADLDLRDLIDLQVQKAARKKTLEEMRQELEADVELPNPSERYVKEVQRQVDAYKKKTSRQKYADNEDYRNFRDGWWSATQDGAMPPVRDLIPEEQGDADDSDEEIVAGGQTQSFRCPLTANLLEDPVTNTVCKHSYSKAAIMEYLQSNNKCPAASCTAKVGGTTLKEDEQLKRKVTTFRRREEERLLARRHASTILD